MARMTKRRAQRSLERGETVSMADEVILGAVSLAYRLNSNDNLYVGQGG